MTRLLSEALTQTAVPPSPEFALYGLATLALALSESNSVLHPSIQKLLYHNFAAMDGQLDKAFHFVSDFTFLPADMERPDGVQAKYDQNWEMRAFAAEALGFAVASIDNQPKEVPIDTDLLVANAISIGGITRDLSNRNYSRVLVEGAQRGVWGIFETEAMLVRELLCLSKREDKIVLPAILAHKKTLDDIANTPEGAQIATAFFDTRITNDVLHYLRLTDGAENAKVQVLTGLADVSPFLFAHLTKKVIIALCEALYFDTHVAYEYSTLGGLAGEVVARWEQFPWKTDEQKKVIKNELGLIDLAQSDDRSTKPVIDKLQQLISDKLA